MPWGFFYFCIKIPHFIDKTDILWDTSLSAIAEFGRQTQEVIMSAQGLTLSFDTSSSPADLCHMMWILICGEFQIHARDSFTVTALDGQRVCVNHPDPEKLTLLAESFYECRYKTWEPTRLLAAEQAATRNVAQSP